MTWEEQKIIRALEADPKREVYESGDHCGDYWITYQGGGPFQRAAILHLIDTQFLVRKYDDMELYVLSKAQALKSKARQVQ